MTSKTRIASKVSTLGGVSALVMFAGLASATPLALPDLPLFLPESVPPLNMIVLGRDHKLYYEAYNDHSDLNDDDVLDVGYKPTEIDYYGYFDSYKCYEYNASSGGGEGRFNPLSVTANKKCSGAWSGDFLNYVTTSRIDALRKVLYGGLRNVDNDNTTLERSFIPQDAHSWGKEYESVARDGYDISEYTPLALPTTGTRHLFANTTPLGTSLPLMRVLQSQSVRIWNWLSIERPVAGTQVVTGVNAGGGEIRGNVTPTDYTVRVRVCTTALPEANCQAYPNGRYKPIGLLQEFGENDSMYFGLLSGSYSKNTSGGVLRRQIASIRDEVDPDNGRFLSFDGIITTLNRLRMTGFGSGHQYACAWNAAARPINEGECQMWGNPVGEMMYEAMRYFAGKEAPTAAFATDFGAGEESSLPGLGLPVATWDNPYSTASGRPVCSKPFVTVVSDINPSYDSDQVPGSVYGSFSGDMPAGLSMSTLGQKIWTTEIGGSGNYFIGDVAGVTNGAPTPKVVSSFGNIRGLSPEEPTKQGSYSSASVAHYGKITDLNGATGDQKVNTFSVALASPLPHIEIPIGTNRKVTLVPFAKSVGGSGITATEGQFQPTNQIVDFYVDTLTSTSGRFRVNFEDVEQGADHDMDAIVVYDYSVSGDQVTVTLNSEYAAGGIIHHLGFVVAGTTEDGIYLGVRDRDTAAGSDPDYFLDTPNIAGALPLTYTKTFTAGSTGGASFLKDPLWYAAKWGGFDETYRDEGDRNDIPDAAKEWDEDGDGQPDNYFLVTNALKLSQQLRKAFQDILRRTTASSSASVNSGSISSETRIYQARFNTGEWTGELISYELDPSTGAVITDVDGNPDWEASEEIPAADSRDIITTNIDDMGVLTPVRFRWNDLSDIRKDMIDDTDATRGADLVDYLRGDQSDEGEGDDEFRVRRGRLGDIVSSSPLFVGAPPFRYRDSLETVTYSSFATAQASRRRMVYAGANDGMLHGFDAEDGEEVFAFIPSAVFPNLKLLAEQNYSHRFFVDGAPSMGDAFFGGAWHTVLAGGLNGGGQEIYALDVTNPTTLASAETNPGNIVLWEFTDANDSDLGYTYSQPAIVKMHTASGSRWAAVFGNGYNSMEADGRASTTGNAVLFIVDIQTGALLKKIDTGVGIAQAPTGVTWDNGLATPALVDLNGDRIVEYAYAGDLYGNMWKFDLSSNNLSDWGVAFEDASNNPLPLYQARDGIAPLPGNAQPITSRPEVARGPGGNGMMVLFGTGKYLEPNDKLLTPIRRQSFYGIWDKNTGADSDRVGSRANLLRQQIIAETSYDFTPTDGINNPLFIRATTNNVLSSQSGWYIDLVSPVLGYQAEKQVTNPIVRNGNVIFTTLIPDANPCNFGGGSWIMEMKLLDGSRLDQTPFDNNHDGRFDDADRATIIDINGNEITVPITGVGSTEGILQSAGVIEGENGAQGGGGGSQCVQYKYLPGSSGNIQKITENCGPGGTGRQSWRQVR